MNSTLSLKSYFVALGTIGVLAVGAVGASALFAHASAGPVVTTKTTNANNATVTSAVIGTNVTENASVASSTATTTVPTGTVTFSTFNNLTCSGTSTVQSGVALLNGAASSSAIGMTNAGLSYLVNYSGDATNTPSVSSCTVVTPTSAAVTVTNALSANTVTAGSSITAHATLAGNTATATGTVAYNVYTNNTCTLGTTSPASVTVLNGVVPTSASFAFTQPGTYFVQAAYSGDNANAAALSQCGSAVLTVNATSTGIIGHKGDNDGDKGHGIASTTFNGHKSNDNDADDNATTTSNGHEGKGEDGFKLHLPNLNANFHAFLGSFNGKHKGEDQSNANVNATAKMSIKGGDNDQDGD